MAKSSKTQSQNTQQTTTGTQTSNNPFGQMMELMTEMNPWTAFQPMAEEMQSTMQQNVQDWMALQQEVQQTMQQVVTEQKSQMMTQMNANIQQGVQLSKTMLDAQKAFMAQTVEMMDWK